MAPLLFTGLFCVPGYLLARLLRPGDDGFARLVTAGLLGLPAVGWLMILAAITLDQPFGFAGLAGISGGLSALLLALCRWRGRTIRLHLAPGDGALLAVSAMTLLVYLVHYDRDLFQFNCVNRAAALVLGLDTDPLRVLGPRTDLGYLLADNRNVRLGNAALVAPGFIAFGFVGSRLVYAWAGAMVAAAGGLLGRRLLGRSAWAPLLGLCMALNPYLLAIPLVDENLFAFMLTTAILCEVADDRPSPAVLGVLLGLLLGVRHIGVLVVPGLLWLLRGRDLRTRGWALGAAVAAVTCVPWAIHHARVFGSVWAFESFEEVRTPIVHRLFGLDIPFRGLLNYPFTDTWVRTPFNPAPTIAMVPLFILNRFGLLACALTPFGVAALRGTRLPALRLGALALPLLGVISALESWMQPNKMGIPLLVLPALVLILVLGARRLARARRARPFLVYGLVVAGLAGAQLGLERWSVPEDARVYDLGEAFRRERPAYLAWEQAHLVRHNLLPDASRIFEYTPFQPGRKLRDLWLDLGRRELRRAPRPRPPASARRTVVELDLGQPLVGRSGWLRRVDAAPHWRWGDGPRALRLGPLSWAELPAQVGVVPQTDDRVLQLIVEIGSPALFGDYALAAGGEQASHRVQGPLVRLEVPDDVTVVVTDVIADEFSKYYRWTAPASDPGRTVGPRIVFTN